MGKKINLVVMRITHEVGDFPVFQFYINYLVHIRSAVLRRVGYKSKLNTVSANMHSAGIYPWESILRRP